LAFFFEKNKLRINRLPVEFSGKLDFLQNGYDMDFTLNSKNSKLKHLITALPPQYLKWLEKTKVEGSTDIFLKLKGQYIASANTSPELVFDMNIRDGYINYDKAPMAAEGIYLNLHSKMPSLNSDSLELKVDSINFNVGKNYFKGRIDIKGLSKPNIVANVNTKMNLEEVDRSLGIELFDVKGNCDADIVVNGVYDLPNGKFPVTRANINISNGYIRTGYYPQPINNIQLKADVKNAAGTLNGLSVVVAPASFNFENKPFSATASLRNFDNIIYDIKAKGIIDLAKIYKVFSLEGLALEGYIAADVNLKGSQEDATNGRYDRLNNSGTLDLKNININSHYFPHPFLIKNGLFRFDREKVLFNNFTADYAHSDFNLNGYFANLIGYLFSPSEILKGDFIVNSGLVNVNEFMSDNVASTDSPSSATTGVIAVPRVYDLSLTTNAQRVLFNDLVIENLKGKVAVDTGTVFLENTSFSTIGCNVQMNAKYKPYAAQRVSFDYAIKANDFDIKRAYDSVKIFRELASSAEYAEGIVSLDYNLKG
ncbi:MAG: hypothetical protein J7497_15685, partial [Chitinophagaceae bacterium]|nr:hypothetical protein [Chitinophagaceae bacterium]